jgi:hypothetical protein
MACYALVFLAAALLCTAVLAQDVTPAHRGGKSDTFSSYDALSQRYRPVSADGTADVRWRQPGSSMARN